MAAYIRGINAKIRAHPWLNYVCSTRENPPFTIFYRIFCIDKRRPSFVIGMASDPRKKTDIVIF